MIGRRAELSGALRGEADAMAKAMLSRGLVHKLR